MQDRAVGCVPSQGLARALFLLAVLLALRNLPAQTPVPHKPLQTIAAVVNLGNEAARSGVPVHLVAQATYIDTEWGILFVQNASGSLYIQIGRKPSPVAAGDMLEITGVTAPGSVAPIVAQPHLRVIGHAPMPTSALIDEMALQNGFDDSRFVLTRGVLRPAPAEWNHTAYLLVDRPTVLPIIVPGGKSSALDSLIGSVVTVRAVNGVREDASHRRAGSQLFVPALADIQPEAAAAEPSNLPISHVASLDSLDLNRRFLAPVRLRGIVAWKGPRSILLRDATATIYVLFPVDVAAETGQLADLIGFPEVQSDQLVLKDAQILKAEPSRNPQPAPLPRSAEELIQSGRTGDPVRIEGRLLSQEAGDKEYVMTVSDAGTVFSIRVPSSGSAGQFVTLAPGSLMQSTGIVRMQGKKGGRMRSFELLVASPSQILVRTNHAVSWKSVLAVAFPLAILATLVWIVQLKRALRLKAAQIRSQLENEVRLETRYRRLFQRNLAGVFSWLPSGEITDCNEAFARLLGFSSTEDLIGRSYLSFCADKPCASAQDEPSVSIETSREISLRRADGRTVYLLEQITSVGSGSGMYYETTALDITQTRKDRIELQRARDLAQREAEQDALTGLPNRRRFSELLEESVRNAERLGVPLSLLYLDLDGFKMVNDSLGHEFGDVLLKAVGDRLLSHMAEGSVVCRIGGDEFAILLAGSPRAVQPMDLARSILETLHPSFHIYGKEFVVGASIGISTLPATASSASALMQQSDSAMYVAKRSGKNRAVMYTEEIGKKQREKSMILSELKYAIGRRELSVHYQPEFDVQTGRIVRFEALARWQNMLLGPVSPDKFIPVAEQYGYIRELGAYLLEQACGDAVRWQQRTGQEISVAVNVSTVQLQSSAFIDDVLAVLERTGLRPDLLELEMTESVMIEDPERIGMLLKRLRSSGITLALDDFGTGYSCLSYLRELEFDRIKVDRSFLRQADQHRGTAVINAVVSVAHSLEMTVVVEGIENKRQLEFVKRLGADGVQGFFLGRPTADPIALLETHLLGPVPSSGAA